MANTPSDNNYLREWRKRNEEKMRAYHRAYYLAHREKKTTYSKAWIAANPERAKLNARGRARRYAVKRWGAALPGNVTVEEYVEEMMSAQEGCCAICGGEFTETPNLDHNHATGTLRGLVCEPCNFGVGFLRDNPDLIRNAAEYVESYA